MRFVGGGIIPQGGGPQEKEQAWHGGQRREEDCREAGFLSSLGSQIQGVGVEE